MTFPDTFDSFHAPVGKCFYLELWIKDTRILALLDSGAASNLMYSGLAEMLGLTPKKLRRPCYFQGAAGRSEICETSTRCHAHIGRARAHLFFRLAKCRIPVILGVPFLAYFNVRFDWENRAASMRFHGSRIGIPVHFSDSSNVFSTVPPDTVVLAPMETPLTFDAISTCSDPVPSPPR